MVKDLPGLVEILARPLAYPVTIEDVHLSVSSEGAYGVIATLNFRLSNSGLLPASYRVEVLFEGPGGYDKKTMRGIISGRSSKGITLDTYIPVTKATIKLYRAFGVRAKQTVEVQPT